MGLFGNKQNAQSVALIDISSSSVRVAYAGISPSAPVALYYASRVPMPVGDAVTSSAIMLRTIDEALRKLRDEGASLLHRRTGSGSVSGVYVSLGGPWQDASIRIETLVEEKNFTFTPELLEKARKAGTIAPGRIRSEDTVVATLLNGYETKNPIGKKAKHAEIIIMSASIEEEVANVMQKTLGHLSHGRSVTFSTFASLILESVSVVFPLEKDYMALRVSGEATELLFVKHGLPLYSSALSCGLNDFFRAARKNGLDTLPSSAIDRAPGSPLDTAMKAAEQKWLAAFTDALKTFTASHALPRTLFLVADPEVRAFMREVIDVPDVHALWLSDDPLALLTLESKHFATHVGGEAGMAGELPIDMLGLLARARLSS